VETIIRNKLKVLVYSALLTNDGSCACEIKSRVIWQKLHLTTRGLSLLDLQLRNKPVKCYILSIALCGAETWMLRAVDKKQLESFEMWCWRRMKKLQLGRSCEK
jgi:hypothetical protein